MKKSILVLSILISFSVSGTFAQTDTINFSDYKLPDLKRQSLDFMFDLSNLYKNKNTKDSLLNNSISSLTHLTNSFNVKYNYYKNTRKKQIQYSAALFSNNSFLFKKDNLIDSLSNKISNNNNYHSLTSGYFSNSNRFYFSKNYFFGTYLYLTSQYSYLKSKTLTNEDSINIESKIRSSALSTQISPTISIGKGRIEPVTDIIQSMYIFKELEKKGLIIKNPNKKDINKFAELISKIKNERFFDSRLKQMYELEKIDSFLISNNFISKQDIKYFTVLNDNWLYAGNNNRVSGTRTSINFSPVYWDNHNKQLYSDSSKYIRNQFFNIQSKLSFYTSKPLSLYWHRTISADVGYDSPEILNNNDSILSHSFYQDIAVSFSVGYDYYPNTRTYFNLLFSAGYNNNSIHNLFPVHNKSINSEIDLSAYYYLSPRLRLSLNGKTYYNYLNNTDSENLTSGIFTFTVYGGLEYSLF